MSTIVLKVSVDPVFIRVQSEDYREAWQELCEEDGAVEEGEDAGEPPESFILEKVQEEFESGDRDLSEAFESASIDVRLA